MLKISRHDNPNTRILRPMASVAGMGTGVIVGSGVTVEVGVFVGVAVGVIVGVGTHSSHKNVSIDCMMPAPVEASL